MSRLDEILENMNVWILSDGKMGHVNQSIGVANNLGVNYKVIELEPKKYGKIFGHINGIWAVKNKISPPFPSMVIGTGTLAGLVSGWIKQQNPETITVQMMRPPNKYYLYDVIAVPMHDKMKNLPNVIHTVGSPNTITQQKLLEEKQKWANKLAKLENPLAVLIGGSNKYFTFTEENTKKFAVDIIKFAKKNKFKSLLVTASRRTGEKQTEIIKDIFENSGLSLYFWQGEGANPYHAYLAYAQSVVVTADSISMVSESCTAGLPVCVYGIENMQSKKFQKFFNVLISKQVIQRFDLDNFNNISPENPLSDTQMVVGAISSVCMKKYNFIG